MNAATLIIALALASAQVDGFTGLTDLRIRVISYDPGQVVTLPVSPGYAAVVELGPDERVDSVVVGDANSWQVTANKRGDHVVVKPLGNATTTNMVVITGDRRYVFLLQPGGSDGSSPFVLRFIYPEAVPVTAVATSPVATFRFRGAKALFPAAMQDDGRRTIVSWGKDTPLPAIFAVGDHGREALVNGRMVGTDYVIEGTAIRYIFRLAKARAVASRRIIEAVR
jgi:type IV secretion system protein VirB9